MMAVGTLPDPKENETALAGIPAWRRQYILRCQNAPERKRRLGAWLLLQRNLAALGLSDEAVRRGANGKPECEGIYFNLSHSGEMALCAVSDRPVGCDIEKIRPMPKGVAVRYYSAEERRYIAEGQAMGETDRRFFRIWTMKESYMKMTGEGLSLSPERIAADLNNMTILRDQAPQPCRLQNDSSDAYEWSVCFETSKDQDDLTGAPKGARADTLEECKE